MIKNVLIVAFLIKIMDINFLYMTNNRNFIVKSKTFKPSWEE